MDKFGRFYKLSGQQTHEDFAEKKVRVDIGMATDELLKGVFGR